MHKLLVLLSLSLILGCFTFSCSKNSNNTPEVNTEQRGVGSCEQGFDFIDGACVPAGSNKVNTAD